jgi:hypothetical protein
MAAPLNTGTTIEQRGVVRFFWAKNMAAKDIHKEMFPGTSETVVQVFKFVLITLKYKCCLYAIIPISFFSITICNLLIDFPS